MSYIRNSDYQLIVALSGVTNMDKVVDNQQNKTWSVIKFPDEKSVSAVPSSWIVGKKCYWPPYSEKALRAAIENNESPNFQVWQSYTFESFRNNVFDTFKEADKKSLKATKTSDLESGCETKSYTFSSKKRKIFRKTVSFSSVEEEGEEEEGDEEEESVLPDPPSFKKQRRELQPNVEINTFDQNELLKRQEERRKRDILPQRSENLSTPRVSEENNEESDSKTIIKYLQSIIRKQNILHSTLLDITNRLSNIENKNTVLQIENSESIFITLENLPVNTEEDLAVLEDHLGEGMEHAVNELSNLGGATIYDFIFRATEKLITNNFCGIHYSYEGKRKKKAFRNLKLHELLIKSSLALFKNVTIKDVEISIQKWIRRCSERAKATKHK
ncbi:hypothetical protein PPYR_00214 [Photinus pyralis]|uniref:Uncharacterized protein n=1 Tax=Photinus pyralis TaxID=7054 RepID=A0A5N4B0Y3_PHOPY|nr:hypothetical protein PPYR_00214 [Photinus pyralis]